MANEEQRRILYKGVEAWNKWREDNPDVEIDLEGADFEGSHRAADYLNNVNFSGANLSGAHFLSTYLNDANLSGGEVSSGGSSGVQIVTNPSGKSPNGFK